MLFVPNTCLLYTYLFEEVCCVRKRLNEPAWEARYDPVSYTHLIAMLHDFHSGGGSHHRTHGRQVHRRSAVTASADNVSGLPLNVELDGVAYHGFGRSANLARGQTELLLGCLLYTSFPEYFRR